MWFAGSVAVAGGLELLVPLVGWLSSPAVPANRTAARLAVDPLAGWRFATLLFVCAGTLSIAALLDKEIAERRHHKASKPAAIAGPPYAAAARLSNFRSDSRTEGMFRRGRQLSPRVKNQRPATSPSVRRHRFAADREQALDQGVRDVRPDWPQQHRRAGFCARR